MSIAAAEEIFKCREAAASFPCGWSRMRGIYIKLYPGHQYGVKGLCQTGRPHCNLFVWSTMRFLVLCTMADRMHVTFTEVTVTPVTNDATVNAFRQALKPNTSLIVCTHASNVWSIRLPVERIASLGREIRHSHIGRRSPKRRRTSH